MHIPTTYAVSSFFYTTNINCPYCQTALFLTPTSEIMIGKDSGDFIGLQHITAIPRLLNPKQLVSWFSSHHCLHQPAPSLSSLCSGRRQHEFHQNEVVLPSLYLQPISELSHMGPISVSEASHPQATFKTKLK